MVHYSFDSNKVFRMSDLFYNFPPLRLYVGYVLVLELGVVHPCFNINLRR